MLIKKKIPDVALVLVVILLTGLIRGDRLMMIVYFLLYPYLWVSGRRKSVFYLLLASGMAFLWMLISRGNYGYNRVEMLSVAGFNLFPFFAWSLGLFVVYLIQSEWKYLKNKKNRLKRFTVFAIMYWSILITLETVFYHIFKLKNLVTAPYAGFPFCDCLHAPRWMQGAYLTIGLLFFMICEGIELKILKKSKIHSNKKK